MTERLWRFFKTVSLPYLHYMLPAIDAPFVRAHYATIAEPSNGHKASIGIKSERASSILAQTAHQDRPLPYSWWMYREENVVTIRTASHDDATAGNKKNRMKFWFFSASWRFFVVVVLHIAFIRVFRYIHTKPHCSSSFAPVYASSPSSSCSPSLSLSQPRAISSYFSILSNRKNEQIHANKDVLKQFI